MTKKEIIAELKKEFPKLTRQLNDEIIDLTPSEYEETINRWADNRLKAFAEEAEAETKATARQAILDRLGITTEEASLLLG